MSPAAIAAPLFAGLFAMTMPTDGARADAYLDHLAATVGTESASLQHRGRVGPTEYLELRLTSQEWQGVPWRHQLYLVRPSTLDPAATRHAIMFVGSGRWHDSLDDPDGPPGMPANMQLYAMVAELLAVPVALVRQVPFQPMFEGMTEDRLIAHSFERYLAGGDDDWPLLVPMVTAVVRAMDAVQDAARAHFEVEIEGFTLTGASKRGWTTWLTAAVEPRVLALAPMVIDMLDMPAHLDHQIASWGAYSPQLRDYTSRGLQDHVDNPRGESLLDIVDPYRRRADITQPKLIVISTNDPYWPLDSANLYRDGLEGPTRLLYMPNEGHAPRDYTRIIGALAALHDHGVRGADLPEPRWQFTQTDDRLLLELDSDHAPAEVAAWRAQAETRDFRTAEWTRLPCRPTAEGHVCEVEMPDDGHVALFGELTYVTDTALPFTFTTAVRIAARGPAG